MVPFNSHSKLSSQTDDGKYCIDSYRTQVHTYRHICTQKSKQWMKWKSFCAQLQALMNPISTTIIVICSMKNKFRVTTNVVAATITKLITLGCANDLIRKVLKRANSKIFGKRRKREWERKRQRSMNFKAHIHANTNAHKQINVSCGEMGRR